MTIAALDRWLAVLVVALAVTGLVSLRMGSPGDAWLFAGHDLLAAALAIGVVLKISHSLPRAIHARRWAKVAIGLVVSIAAAATLVAGLAWVSGGRLLSIGSWTVLTIHAWIGLMLVPLVAVHLAPRRWRLLLPQPLAAQRRTSRGFGRRQLLVAAAFGLASVALFGTTQLADRVAGGVRRFTGSRWLAPDRIPPPTTFYGESPPEIEASGWRLRVHGRVAREISLSIDQLKAVGEVDLRAVLDCTSGWAIDTTWHGVPLRAILRVAGADAGPRAIHVRSATGYATALTPEDAEGALLATDVAAHELPAASGAPCRLVVPNHRGLDWVKWVTDVEVV